MSRFFDWLWSLLPSYRGPAYMANWEPRFGDFYDIEQEES